MRRMFLMSASLGLSACATVPQPVVVQPKPIIAPVRPPASPRPAPRDWRDRAFSAGGWTLAQEADGMVARFGRTGAESDFIIACVGPTRTIRFGRAGSLPELITSKMTLSSTEISKSYDAANSKGLPPNIWSETQASDPQLDALAFSRGRFLVSVIGTDDLVIPSWPEFAYVVEDCRTAGATGSTAKPQPVKSDAKIN